jgi:hypothetical protein
MINPEEITQQALKWWQPFLQSHILNEPFFPKEIARIGKAKPGDITHRFDVLQDEIEALYRESKNEKGSGYWVKTAANNFRRTGTHQLPDSIVFETAEDYLHVTRKKSEWERFTSTYDLLISRLPQLRNWIFDNPLALTARDTNWEGIVVVSEYFIRHPRPALYIRQLPIPVHTKFIEENESLIQSLLDFLIPDHIRDQSQRKFADRYYLQRDEPLIRLRILASESPIINQISDISIRLSDFETWGWPYENVMLTENKMNFLTLPRLSSTIAIWSGGGFKVRYLRNARWLEDKNIYYWGDIDEHGFQILHQLRSYYNQTRSVMMDVATFDRFQEFVVAGEQNKAEKLSFLNEEEAHLYERLKKSRPLNRLEQEKIPQDYVTAYFLLILKNGTLSFD